MTRVMARPAKPPVRTFPAPVLPPEARSCQFLLSPDPVQVTSPTTPSATNLTSSLMTILPKALGEASGRRDAIRCVRPRQSPSRTP
eukprot:COSAG04_NODE_827_length_10036_cov_6.659455_12_plen_86_part_00